MENMSLSDIAAVTRGNDDGDGWGACTRYGSNCGRRCLSGVPRHCDSP